MSVKGDYKNDICITIENLKSEILDISHKIHDNPETGLEERFACKLLTQSLSSHGFKVDCGIGGLETAFSAVYASNKEGPRIAILAEYDALRGIGHGCGHNIVAASAYGAAVSLPAIVDEVGGCVAVIGTPAEETLGGKINLLDAGVFDIYDFAMMVHPTNIRKNILGRCALACTGITYEFVGKSSHSALERQGINALSACINTFQNIAGIRSSFSFGQMVNGVILDGGSASNIVPGYAKAEFCLRAKNVKELNDLIERVDRCAKAGAEAVGTKLNIVREPLFTERYSNHAMDEAFQKNLELLGKQGFYPRKDDFVGSSDIGNVSLKLPTIHEYISIADENINMHSVEFAEVTTSEKGDEGCILGAKALAMTALDLLTDNNLREETVYEFKNKEEVNL